MCLLSFLDCWLWDIIPDTVSEHAWSYTWSEAKSKVMLFGTATALYYIVCTAHNVQQALGVWLELLDPVVKKTVVPADI